MTPEELDAAIRSGDPGQVRALLEAASETERRAAAPVALEWHRKAGEHWNATYGGRGALLPVDLYEALRQTAGIAVVGTAGKREALQARLTHDELFELLSRRRPSWLQSYVEDLLADAYWYWPLVRRFERAGLVTRPATERYAVGMVVAGCQTDPYRMLLEDPELLEEQVWRLFEVEGDREASLASSDKYTRGLSWTESLLRLSGEGRLSRDRLLDASLDALARDFAQFRAGWFSRFHEALQPTLPERAERCDRYLHLLGSPIPPTVSFALKALAAVDRAGKLAPAELLAHAAPVLVAREKGTVLAALKLLGRAAAADPSLASRAATLAADALIHEAPEVQSAAFDLIEKHGAPLTPELRQLLDERREDVAASHRSRLDALMGAAAPAEAEAEACAEADLADLTERAGRVPRHWRLLAGVDAVLQAAVQGELRASALCLPVLGVPRLADQEEVQPICDLDELIDSFTALLEAQEPPEEIERLLDGLSRLCAERPADFERRTGPLRKRAARLWEDEEWSRTWWGAPHQDLSALALAWTTGRLAGFRKPRGHEGVDLAHFAGLRLYELAQRVVARRPRPLLAFPTHTGGWIDPPVLVERVKAAQAWDLADAVQALLRLAPEHRGSALEQARGLSGELGQALRYALGGEEEIGPTAALWVAAARSRRPLEDDPGVEARHPGLGPDAGLAARCQFRVEHSTSEVCGHTYHYYLPHLDTTPPVPKARRVDLPTVLHHVSTHEEQAAHRRWSALIWPLGRRAWLAAGVRHVGRNLDWDEAEWTHRVFLEALLEPDTALGEIGALLLALGLGAKETTEAALSTDALIAAISDGRIDAEMLGAELRRLAPTGLMKPARWARTLGVAARISALHREVVREALTTLVASRAEMRPADLGAILTLLHELCVESGAAISGAEARAALAETRSGKSGAIAKALLALTEKDRSAHVRSAAVAALTGRIERAERWAAGAERMSGRE